MAKSRLCRLSTKKHNNIITRCFQQLIVVILLIIKYYLLQLLLVGEVQLVLSALSRMTITADLAQM